MVNSCQVVLVLAMRSSLTMLEIYLNETEGRELSYLLIPLVLIDLEFYSVVYS